jgi:transposase InsO family protein
MYAMARPFGIIAAMSIVSELWPLVWQCLRQFFRSRRALVLENLGLRSQLALFEQQVIAGKRPKPQPTPVFRRLWVWLSKNWSDWRSALMIVKPETVIRWHRLAFRWYWRQQSKPRGRPTISPATISTIKRVHRENPLWSPERIHDQLVSLNLTDVPAPNSIAKYLPDTRTPPSEKQRQSWRTFLANHRQDIWAMDFFTMPTLMFQALYVLVIIRHDRRVIQHVAVTAHPTAEWVVQQLREAMPYDEHPRYLLHDNDSIFTSQAVTRFLESAGVKGTRIAYHSPWQNGICERAHGSPRRELLDHLVPLNERHLLRMLTAYVHQYYNVARTHQGVDRQAPVPPKQPPAPADLTVPLNAAPILGGLYHTYRRAA